MDTKHINKYLEKVGTTIEDILGKTDAFVFGGSLVDSMIEYPINDIDIIGFTESIDDIYEYLCDIGFNRLDDSELDFMYKDIHWFRTITMELDGCNVQLIGMYPNCFYEGESLWSNRTRSVHGDVIEIITKAVKNVDIDICGVMWNPNLGFIEACTGAINGIQNKQMKVLNDNMMHQEDRIITRIEKYKNKGFSVDYSNFKLPKNANGGLKRRYNAFKEGE